MSRKHYVLLAEILRQEFAVRQLAGSKLEEERELVRLLCRALKDDNLAFQKETFAKACGL